MNYAVVLSGGVGLRIKADIPKQYLKIEGRMIISYCLETIILCEAVDRLIVVANEKWHRTIEEEIEKIVEKYSKSESCSTKKYKDKFLGFALPGAERQESIFNALEYIEKQILAFNGLANKENIIPEINVLNNIEKKVKVSDNVLIHDAARPFVTNELLTACFDEIGKDGCSGVMPILSCKDTMYYSEDGKQIDRLLDRSRIYAGQAPEAFVFEEYLDVNRRLLPDDIKLIRGSSEAAIRCGMKVNLIQGDESNIKITSKEDIRLMTEMIRNG